MLNSLIKKHISPQISIAPLAVFRALFGLVMLASVIRFAVKGWIGELYIQPGYHFTYYGFDWVQPLGEYGMYGLFALMGLSALGIMLGSFYRLASVLFFLSFTYVELIDKTNYLNHYYFVSIVSFLLMLLPAHRSFSLDVVRKPGLKVDRVPAWTITILKLQLGIVYFYAGLAKLNPDWLFSAMPLQLWLPAKAHLPVIGWMFDYELSAYLFSWAGALYDLSIPFLLLYRPTRYPAYAAVVVFHLLTAVLFPIGMFPYIMILSTLIFFSSSFHERLIAAARSAWGRIGYWQITLNETGPSQGTRDHTVGKRASRVLTIVLTLYFILQILIPFRFALYPGKLFWTEQGYRFSWRVMLMEKAGYATFHVHDPETGRSWQASNYEHLTPMQEKMMATQPDMILQFAHYLENHYRNNGIDSVRITTEAYVTLNGQPSRLLIDPAVDLTKKERGFHNKEWIFPYDDRFRNQKTRL